MNSPNKQIHLSLFLRKKKLFCVLLFLIVHKPASFCQDINPNGYNTFYYENGSVASEGEFKNGVPVGLWKSYYPDGILKSTGYKSSGLSDSVWNFYNSQGLLIQRYHYKNDKKNGCAQQFDSLGHVFFEMYYVDDVPVGEKQWLYPDGTLKKQVLFINGKEEGLSIEYSKEGNVITEELYDNGYLKDRTEYNQLDENRKKTGLWREYYADGTIKTEQNYRNGEKFGIAKTYNQKGKLVDIQDMTSDSTNTKADVGIIELYKEYYPGARIKLIGGLVNNKKSGIYREYDSIGNLINGFIYKNDTLVSEGMILFDGTYNGKWVSYYPNGKTLSTGTYANGVQNDLWVYYYPNGKKEQEGKFRNNLPYGAWTWYYANGQIKRTENYNPQGKLEGTMVEYDSTGNEIARGEYYEGLQEGPWFYQVGDHKEVGSFTVGQPDGMWFHYYKNGKIAFAGVFEEGIPKGKHTWYHTNGIKKKIGKYSGGVPHGVWRSYDVMGEATEEIVYKNGETVKINGFKIKPAEEN
ncbi:MAG: hypothetical protein IPM77_03495 [Crocinitomicaceae bacterium]|nr:hypothetical protein [Crocinitomicaceae bacterium]